MSPVTRPVEPAHYDPNPPPRKGEVKIAHDDKVIRVSLGDGPPQITDGFGGWVEVERPHDEPITRWASQPALRMDLPLLLDSFGTGHGVEADLDKILALGRKKDGQKPPPVFRVTGAVPFSGSKWVMETSPDMGDAIYQRGQLVRQFLTISLLSYEREDTAKFRKRKGGGGGDGDKGTYRVREGDTLRKIAARLKPDASNEKQREYARAIGALQKPPIRDLRAVLLAGLVLALPRDGVTAESLKRPSGPGGGGVSDHWLYKSYGAFANWLSNNGRTDIGSPAVQPTIYRNNISDYAESAGLSVTRMRQLHWGRKTESRGADPWYGRWTSHVGF